MEFAAISTVVGGRKISIDRFLNGESERSRVLILISARKYLLTYFLRRWKCLGSFHHAVSESFSYRIKYLGLLTRLLNQFERTFFHLNIQRIALELLGK